MKYPSFNLVTAVKYLVFSKKRVLKIKRCIIFIIVQLK